MGDVVDPVENGGSRGNERMNVYQRTISALTRPFDVFKRSKNAINGMEARGNVARGSHNGVVEEDVGSCSSSIEQALESNYSSQDLTRLNSFGGMSENHQGTREKIKRFLSISRKQEGEATTSTSKSALNDEGEEIGQDNIHLRRYRLVLTVLKKFMRYLGPGLMVSIAYMDPGNYATAVSGGAEKRYKLLFVILLSTVLALYLQIIALRLGSATGKDYAQNSRDHLPRWMCYTIYIFAECAIMCTDVAEVIGTAIALKVLLHIPLIGGVFVTIADVLFVMLAYNPQRGMKAVRVLEILTMGLIISLVVLFCVLLARIPSENVGTVLFGYVPSSAVIEGDGIILSAGILGATVMPHSLYLGSSTVIPRIRACDERRGYVSDPSESEMHMLYRPSRDSIRRSMPYSVSELAIALFSVALFVNSAILIIAASTMYGNPEAANADLFGLYDLLKSYLSKGAAVVFMVALLCSGQSAGIICTMAGQIVSEGYINWRVRPWLRRIITRLLALIPCVIVVATLGQEGLNQALNWSQVILTITLPFLAFPLLYLTSSKKVMSVYVEKYSKTEGPQERLEPVSYANNWFMVAIGLAICTFISVVVVYTIVNVAMTGDPA